MDNTLPIIGYRVFFPDPEKLPEDFPDVESAWARRGKYAEATGQVPYVHPLREGEPEFPVFD